MGSEKNLKTEQSEKLDQIIWANLEDIGYAG